MIVWLKIFEKQKSRQVKLFKTRRDCIFGELNVMLILEKIIRDEDKL